MSGKGNCYDNALCQSLFHTLKVELVYQRKYETRDQAKRSIFWYIEAYYSRVRRHSGIDYMSPLNFEHQVRKSALKPLRFTNGRSNMSPYLQGQQGIKVQCN
ncbi:MAG: putative transposase [Saprospiraceae bacterium]|jgi:putative transposase